MSAVEEVTVGGTAPAKGSGIRRVLWVSTSRQTPGGMTTFVETLSHSPLRETWKIEFIATHREGSLATRGVAFALGVVSFVWSVFGRRPDIVHLHTSHYGSFARKSLLLWLARAARLPVVLHVHAGEFPVFYERMPRPVRWFIRRTLRGATSVVALGQGWSRRLRDIAPGARVVAIPNAIRIVGPSRRAGAGEPVHVVFLGRIGDGKGTFLLLETWAKLCTDGSAFPPARLTIAGDGEVDRARDVVAALGLAASVEVRSWLTSAEVADLLATADVLTLPSRYEGQPMAVLEAMAHGLCVVASPVGGIPDLIEDGASGMLVPPDDVDALAAALRSVIIDRDARGRLGDAALERARQTFDIDVVWHRFDALYRELVEPADRIRKISRMGS